tara:strand:+ start:109 stop:285 length:177 start_codon:yes stop_codon:yes gene_type:complete
MDFYCIGEMRLPQIRIDFSKEPLSGFPKNDTFYQALNSADKTDKKKPPNGANRSGAYI